MDVRLVNLSVDMKERYMNYYLEWKNAGEKMNPGILRNMNPNRFEEMVKALHEFEIGNGAKEVPESVYFLVNEKDRILGAVTIRHSLTERIFNTEGHIGAGIRPSERRNGYATKILELALVKLRGLGIQKALVTCNEDNIGSEKAIIKNGGVRDNDFLESHGNIVKRYWITL
ncbi:GNAT family N-acetyltransferase [Sporosarcina sp. Marseille-Q4063]|uniref:GNAT family N-acetyltransferase n=1 Tax=Sporosarcina sp. Marseille-Q4063 TaxID=2810514 RepID=UPI001BAEC652|nr:GNAT family N-acetyltransferase [Sporosarcina sp. Marseille-Q4063]QUW22811.1 GNAT family N-acetyltransferase [Sporosarcina sp. Marseille-Q4063]